MTAAPQEALIKEESHREPRELLHERDARVDAEQFSSSQPSIWREAYRTMGFSGRPVT